MFIDESRQSYNAGQFRSEWFYKGVSMVLSAKVNNSLIIAKDGSKTVYFSRQGRKQGRLKSLAMEVILPLAGANCRTEESSLSIRVVER